MANKKSESKAALGMVPLRHKEQVTKDARDFRKSLDHVTEAAVQYFFAMVPKREREKLYQRFPNKIFGRPM